MIFKHTSTSLEVSLEFIYIVLAVSAIFQVHTKKVNFTSMKIITNSS